MAEYKNVTILKKQIYDFKRNITSPNNDYLTGYISALSVVEGMLAELPSRSLIEVVCPYYHLDNCSAMPPDNISAFIDVETRLVVARAEAIKEFAERFKEKLRDIPRYNYGQHAYYMVGEQFIDNLVKEMVGEG